MTCLRVGNAADDKDTVSEGDGAKVEGAEAIEIRFD